MKKIAFNFLFSDYTSIELYDTMVYLSLWQTHLPIKYLWFFLLAFKCKSPNETLRPCEVHQSKFPYAKKECSILYSDLFAPCRNVVSLLNIQDCCHENNKFPVINFFLPVPSVWMWGYRVKPCKYLCVGGLYLCRAPCSFQDWNLNIKVVTELWVSRLNNQVSILLRFYLYLLSI